MMIIMVVWVNMLAQCLGGGGDGGHAHRPVASRTAASIKGLF
jgi:hypothetical protein